MSANAVRIVGGEHGGRVLRFRPRPGLRPTPDRVRETVFNWLGQRLDGRACLDLFAGSGALGFEAVSRGAVHVTMVERDRQACEGLARNAELLRTGAVELVRADALEWLAGAARRFDVVFLDPPFDSDLVRRCLERLPGVLAAGALVYVESAERFEPGPGWALHRAGRAGQVNFHLIRHAEE